MHSIYSVPFLCFTHYGTNCVNKTGHMSTYTLVLSIYGQSYAAVVECIEIQKNMADTL